MPTATPVRVNVYKQQTQACGAYKLNTQNDTPPVKQRTWETFEINDSLVVPEPTVELLEGYLDDGNQTQVWHETIQAIYRDNGEVLTDENGQNYTLYTYNVMICLEVAKPDGTFNQSYVWSESNLGQTSSPPFDIDAALYWFFNLGNAWSSIDI